MRRLGLITCLILWTLALSATAAWADGPVHVKSSFSGSFSIPAGQLCDFGYAETFTLVDNAILFLDPNNPSGVSKVLDEETVYVTHTNLDTGYSLSEVDHVTLTFDASGFVQKQVGVAWHLRDAAGKLVVVQAGQVLFDTSTGEVIKVTPNINPDFAAVICPALGGQPAI
jgi:hypothetical protein